MSVYSLYYLFLFLYKKKKSYDRLTHTCVYTTEDIAAENLKDLYTVFESFRMKTR